MSTKTPATGLQQALGAGLNHKQAVRQIPTRLSACHFIHSVSQSVRQESVWLGWPSFTLLAQDKLPAVCVAMFDMCPAKAQDPAQKHQQTGSNPTT